jgi:hypothetical protein
LESSIDPDDAASPSIQFHHYQFATKCTIHGVLPLDAKTCGLCEQIGDEKKRGRVGKRRHLILLSQPIGVFIKDLYLPSLEAYTFHQPRVRILSKNGCGNLRNDAFSNHISSVKTRRDYAEAISAVFNFEIQSDHFGNNRSLSIEGSSVEFHNDNGIRLEVHFHFADKSDQNVASTHAHMDVLIKQLMSEGVLQPRGLILDDTDGCAK